MKTNLISKAVMFAVLAMNAGGAYAEGFNLERISKDTLDQAYIGGAPDQSVETSAFDTAAQTKAPAATERQAAAKPALAAKVPMPATADSRQYKNANADTDGLVNIILIIPRIVCSVVVAPFSIAFVVFDDVSTLKNIYAHIWGVE